MYIDFHSHIFPDRLAARSISYLEQQGNVKARLDGTLSSLLRSMDLANIDKSVICSIATRPAQFDSILGWSKEISSDRIIPFPSVHPEDPDMVEHIGQISGAGLHGIKLHPYYQQFAIDEERLFPAYEKLAAEKLMVVLIPAMI
jgi:predicted TIM-barrel fold metal-dependent hydrolase